MSEDTIKYVNNDVKPKNGEEMTDDEKVDNANKWKRIKLVYGLLEVIQYSIIFAILSFPVAKFIDNYSDFLDTRKPMYLLIIEVLIQLGLAGAGVFIIQKLGRKIPFMAGLWDKTIHTHYSTKTNEVMDVASAVGLITVFFVVQNNLIQKLTYLSKKLPMT